MSEKQRRRKYSPRGRNAYRALKLSGLLGFASVRQLCLTVWGNERTTNDNLNRFIEHHYLQEAHEQVDLAEGRGNRIVFLTRMGMTWVIKKGHVREEDIAYYWRGEGHWHPQYNEHDVAVHDVLCTMIKHARDHPEGAIDMRLDPHAPLGTDEEERSDLSSPLEDSTLLPDRVFALKYYERYATYYLEVDMGTEPRTQWREKMEKYLLSPEVMEPPGAWVLCVAKNQRRMETLLRWSEDLVDGRFLFSSLDRVCYDYVRKGKTLVLERAGDPFGEVWRVVTDEETHALFEDW